MEDPHTKVIKALSELLKKRAESVATTGPYQFFWDHLAPERKSITEVFDKGGDLSREDLYKKLHEVIEDPKHKFSDWLPPKVRLSFSASFERDMRLHGRGRIATFIASHYGNNLRTLKATRIVEKLKGLKGVSEQQ